MSPPLRIALAGALGAVILLAIAWGSVAPLKVARGDGAVVRISLGARPERIEVCRLQSDEELAKLAPQMRQSVVCEGTTARYSLQVRRNGQLLHSQIVRGGGLRHDRLLYVSQNLAVPAGAAVFTVRLARIDTVARQEREEDEPPAGEADKVDDEDRAVERFRVPRPGEAMPARATREVDERRRRREESVPGDLSLEMNVTLEPREVLLVSYDQERRRLTSVRADSRSP